MTICHKKIGVSAESRCKLDESHSDFDQERVRVVARIIEERDAFFDYVKGFEEDLEALAEDRFTEDWACLDDYFSPWVLSKSNPEGDGYKGPGTKEFAEFNRLLPWIMIAVIDEVCRNPEALDAGRCDADGTARPIYRRSPRFLLRGSEPRTLPDYDDCISLLVEQPWPFP